MSLNRIVARIRVQPDDLDPPLLEPPDLVAKLLHCSRGMPGA
jgi:hypothetical protein